MSYIEPLFHPRFRENSWHRRLYEYRYREMPTRISICRYFWSIVSAVLTVPFVAAYRAIPRQRRRQIRLGVYLVVLGIMGVVNYLLGNFRLFLIKLGIIGGGAFLIMAIYLLIEDRNFFRRFLEWLNWKDKPKPPPKPRQPSILMEYLKARKSRVCPYIIWMADE